MSCALHFAQVQSTSWLERIGRPEVLGIALGAAGIAAVTAVTITVLIIRHRERMAKLGQVDS